MTAFQRQRRKSALLATTMALVLAGCSETGGGGSDLVGVDRSGSGAILAHDPRVEAEAIAPIFEFMGKKPIPVETIADNSIVDRLAREGFIEKLYKKR